MRNETRLKSVQNKCVLCQKSVRFLKKRAEYIESWLTNVNKDGKDSLLYSLHPNCQNKIVEVSKFDMDIGIGYGAAQHLVESEIFTARIVWRRREIVLVDRSALSPVKPKHCPAGTCLHFKMNAQLGSTLLR